MFITSHFRSTVRWLELARITALQSRLAEIVVMVHSSHGNRGYGDY